MRLSVQEHFGCEATDDIVPLYVALDHAPQRVHRAVCLVNKADRTFGAGFETEEDGPVSGAKLLMRFFLMLWLVPLSSIALHDIGLIVLVSMAAGCIINFVPRPLLGQTLVEWLASHLNGVPARPRLYIKQGLRRGQVIELPPELIDVYNVYAGHWNQVPAKDARVLSQAFIHGVRQLMSLLRDLNDPRLTDENKQRGREVFTRLEAELREQLASPPSATKIAEQDRQDQAAADAAAFNAEFALRLGLPS